jgi:hypothetical protein
VVADLVVTELVLAVVALVGVVAVPSSPRWWSRWPACVLAVVALVVVVAERVTLAVVAVLADFVPVHRLCDRCTFGTRRTTDKQADRGVSLEAQRAKVKGYAALFDLDLVAIEVAAGHLAADPRARPVGGASAPTKGGR